MSSLSAYFKARLLDGTLSPDAASLHSAFPGTTGASEISGGSYARQAVSFSASSGGIRAKTGSEVFAVPASNTVRWLGFWQAGNWLCAAPAGGESPKNFTSSASTDTVSCPSHGWSDGQKVALFNGTPPGGITEGAIVFVRDATTDTFKLALTAGGAAVNLTSAPSFGCVVCEITEAAFSTAGTYTLNTSSIVIPD